MAKVYFKAIDSCSDTAKVNEAAKTILERIIAENDISLEKKIPLKVHFGERGNQTFIKPSMYDGIIDFLDERHIKSCFIETNVLYVGERTTRETHIRLAEEHSFTRLPVEIADGEHGEDYYRAKINGEHFTECRLGAGFEDYSQIIVLSHFKGHLLAGFGGAIKQLGMGFAARGGKLDQHSKAKPLINPFKCKKCGICKEKCPADAISIGLIPRIDPKKCIGCAACIANCPHGVFSGNWFTTMPKKLREKIAEYALAAHLKRNNIYISFAVNMTKGCDCESKHMKPVVGDLGILGSTDPVALDHACWNLVNEREHKRIFRGEDIFAYAEKIGLGDRDYEIVRL